MTLTVGGGLLCPPAHAQGRQPTVTFSSGAQKPGWLFYVGTQGTFESNPNFLPPPNDPSDFSGTASGGFGYSHMSARSNLSLSGEGRGLLYRELTNLNTFAFGGTLGGGYRPGPNTNLIFNGTVSSDYTRASDILLSQGIVLPQSQVLTMRFNAAVSQTLSTRTRLSASGRFERAQFDAEGLSDGSTLGGVANLVHQLNPTISVGLGYSHDRNKSTVETRDVDTAYGSVYLVLNQRTSVAINGGVSSIGGGGGSRDLVPYGGASITNKSQRMTMNLGYSHQVRQEYGLGQLGETDLGWFNLNRTFGRRQASFNASVTYALNRSPSVSSQAYSTYSASTGLQVPIGRSLRADGGYSYFRTTLPLTESHVAFVAFSYRIGAH